MKYGKYHANRGDCGHGGVVCYRCEKTVAGALMTGVLILLLSYPAIKSIKELMESLSDTAGLAPAILTPVIKTVGIGIITKVAAELCRDAKESGVASFLETAGAALALVVCIPLVEAVLSMIGELL